MLDGRNAKRPKRRRHQFTFSAFIQCGHCGCSMVGEFQRGQLGRGQYVYYHCTGHRGRWEDLAQGGEEQTVTGLKARPADLAPHDTELMAEGENLDLEVRLGLLALDQEVEEEPDDSVHEGQKHGWTMASRAGRSLIRPCPRISFLNGRLIPPATTTAVATGAV